MIMIGILFLLVALALVFTGFVLFRRTVVRTPYPKPNTRTRVPEETIADDEVVLTRTFCTSEAKQKILYAAKRFDLKMLSGRSNLRSSEAELTVTRDDVLWKVRGKTVWTFQRGVLSADAVAEKALESHPNGWSAMAETSNGLQFHLMPLSITAPEETNRRVLWTYASGWDPTVLCTESPCLLPLNPGADAFGITLASTQNSKFSVMPNGDLVFDSLSGSESAIERLCQ